jgi:hypothetical protein
MRGHTAATRSAQCLERLILFGERRLLRALDEFVAHYHVERNHQGLGKEPRGASTFLRPLPAPASPLAQGFFGCNPAAGFAVS